MYIFLIATKQGAQIRAVKAMLDKITGKGNNPHTHHNHRPSFGSSSWGRPESSGSSPSYSYGQGSQSNYGRGKASRNQNRGKKDIWPSNVWAF
jgi:hypothetical protein